VRQTVEQADYSNRIIASAETIDKSLIGTKGPDFVKRMKAALPRLPDVGDKVEQRVDKDSSDEAIVKICESSAVGTKSGS
jgi:hypothetical protein